MIEFVIHTVDTAPDEVKEVLKKMERNYGEVPGVFGAFAESPALLEAYIAIQGIFEQKTTLTSQEQQLIFLAASVENSCHFCVPAHSFVAKNVAKIAPEIVEAVRNNDAISDPKLDALVTFTRIMVQKRGHLDEVDIAAFINAGYSKEQLLEVILGVSVKTMSNYTSHITNPPLGMFASEEWKSD